MNGATAGAEVSEKLAKNYRLGVPDQIATTCVCRYGMLMVGMPLSSVHGMVYVPSLMGDRRKNSLVVYSC